MHILHTLSWLVRWVDSVRVPKTGGNQFNLNPV